MTRPRSTPRSPGARRRRWHGAAPPGWRRLPGVVLTTAFSDAIDAGEDVATHRRRARGVRAGGWRPAGARRPQLLGGRGHGDVVDGRSVRVDHRHQRLRRVRRRGDGGAGLAAAGRSGRASDRGARPAAHRASVRRRDVRHRSGDRSNRPPGRERRSRWARAAGQRRGRRLPVRARPVEREGARVRRQRRPAARCGRPAAARRAVRQGGVGLRRARRTSSGRSAPTSSCGCCSHAR